MTSTIMRMATEGDLPAIVGLLRDNGIDTTGVAESIKHMLIVQREDKDRQVIATLGVVGLFAQKHIATFFHGVTDPKWKFEAYRLVLAHADKWMDEVHVDPSDDEERTFFKQRKFARRIHQQDVAVIVINQKDSGKSAVSA